MNLINMKVSHKIFGNGIIIVREDSYITVKFSNDEMKFIYPNAFDGYITTVDRDLNNKIKEEIEAIKKLEDAKKQEISRREIKDLKRVSSKDEKKERKTKFYTRENIAFKCNYCDGGKSDKEIGFNGICSDKIIRNNIEVEKRTWCSSEEYDRLSYFNGEMSA